MTQTRAYAVKGVVGFAASLLILGGGAAYGQDFTWQGKVAADKTVEVKGLNGRIRATASSGDEVTVTATKHGERSDPAEVDVRVVEHAEGVTICTVYPPAGESANDCSPGAGRHMHTDNNDVRVDYEIGIPKGVRFKAHNVNGAIEASGLTAAVEAHSVNGGLLLTTAGSVSAKTVNGSIDVTVRALGGGLHLATVNGTAKLVLPSAVNANLEAKTVHGAIESDFPLPVEGHYAGKHMSGVLGSGGPQISVHSVNGSLTLRKGR
jgi:hypothetical protein